jgi:hypothetical protein
MLVAQMMKFGSDSARRGYADGRVWNNHPMMWANGANRGEFWIASIFCIITWVAFVAVLIALARYLWFKGDKEKKGR